LTYSDLFIGLLLIPQNLLMIIIPNLILQTCREINMRN